MPYPEITTYVNNLPIGEDLYGQGVAAEGVRTEGTDKKVDLANIPDGLVVGSNLLGFDGNVSSSSRQAVSLSLLAAQRVADADQVVNTPALWAERHDMVLKGLGWATESGGVVHGEYSDKNVAVHEAIIPFLTLAFGNAAGAALILEAIRQLGKMDSEAKWITLFERQSRHFDVSECRFAVAESNGTAVGLRIAAARMVATERRLQFLFFRFKSSDVQLRTAKAAFAAHVDTLEAIGTALKPRLENSIGQYASTLDFG